MCGIAGWFGHLPFRGEHAETVLQRLHHRGPDAKGMRRWSTATLLHARLSIIDLTATGEQPLDNEDGRIWTVFNGEIYNHHVLRRRLEARGHRFRGRSDSEVLPHLYEESGSGFLADVRGMFAFAIYDDAARTLLLARDRYGIKPLFYALLPDGIAFASELAALQALPGIDLDVDLQALSDYTALTYVPAPATFFKGIRALEPGSYIEANLDGEGFRFRTARYHQWSIRPNSSLSLQSATAEAEARLAAAVRSQLESDVPLGSLLSGGIDSSLVSAAAQEGLSPARLRTFNVRFPDVTYDETWAALAVARHIGSEHETLAFDVGGGSWDDICSLLLHAGQPFADTSMFAVNAVSRLMRQRVKVALSGDGGDEAFGGYDLYWQLARLARLRGMPSPVLAGGAAVLQAAGTLDAKYGRWAGRFRDLARDDASVVGGLFTWIRDDEHRRLLRGLDVEPVQRLFERRWEHALPSKGNALERLSALATEVNTRLVLPNDFLFKVDMASMRESLEVRVPMLDEELFAFGMTLPHRLKVRGRTAKVVLREVARRRLPAEVARKPKQGFGVPLDTWAGSEFRKVLRETLTARSPIAAYYDPGAYLPIVSAFCEGRSIPATSRVGLYQRVILLLAVHVTLEQLAARPRSAGEIPLRSASLL